MATFFHSRVELVESINNFPAANHTSKRFEAAFRIALTRLLGMHVPLPGNFSASAWFSKHARLVKISPALPSVYVLDAPRPYCFITSEMRQALTRGNNNVWHGYSVYTVPSMTQAQLAFSKKVAAGQTPVETYEYKEPRPQVLYHCSPIKGLDVLIPSLGQVKTMTSAYGDGVYFSDTPLTGYGENVYRFSGRTLRKLGLRHAQAEGIYVLPCAISFEQTEDGFCKIKDHLSGPASVQMVLDHYSNSDTAIDKAIFEQYKGRYEVATCPNIFYRALGLLLALVCTIQFWRTRNWKWFALGKFLFGRGGEFRIPANIAAEWDTGYVIYEDDTHMSIRPSDLKSLFWIVGTMSVEIVDDKVYGTDVYDFHPQNGQEIDSMSMLQWAWSGGSNDPTQVPAKVAKLIWRLLPKRLRGEFIRYEDGCLLISNNFWNLIGGKPFTSVLEVPLPPEDDPESDEEHDDDDMWWGQ